MPKVLGAFEGFGIEAEYMIVDKESLKVKPITDFVLQKLNNGKLIDEVELGSVAWSNELVRHVIELKCNGPQKSLDQLDKVFHEAILNVNEVLIEKNAILMPTAMHPWMDVETETQLWPFGQKDIYATYDKIFSCKGHGWSNLQSVHINLAFKDESQFEKLYNSIRCVLAFIPWMSASSPFYDSQLGEATDNRLNFYEKNQARVKSIAGSVIPEPLKSFSDYDDLLESIYKEISVYDKEKILQHPWLNSRGAIAKMDVQAIEIRLMDIQESPYMDFCLIHFFVSIVKAIYNSYEKLDLHSLDLQKDMVLCYQKSKSWDSFEIPPSLHKELNKLFACDKTINQCLKDLFLNLKAEIPNYYHSGISKILEDGNLSKRITKHSKIPSKTQYKHLIHCLTENSIYA